MAQALRRPWRPGSAMQEDFLKLARAIDSIRGRRPVVFVANPGNWGDAMIRAGTLKFFDDFSIPYCERTDLAPQVDPAEIEASWRRAGLLARFVRRSRDIVVFGGGGSWCRTFPGSPARVRSLARQCARVIVLPSSYELRPADHTIPPNVTYFARDKYESLANAPGATFCHDMAFFLGGLPSLEGCGDGFFFRTDLEAVKGAQVPDNNVDISQRGDAFTPIGGFFAQIGKYKRIHTDRLHVAIAAVLLGKDVTLSPGNYFKNEAVFRSSIEPYFAAARFAGSAPV